MVSGVFKSWETLAINSLLNSSVFDNSSLAAFNVVAKEFNSSISVVVS